MMVQQQGEICRNQKSFMWRIFLVMGKESQYVRLKSSIQNGMDNIMLLLLKMCMYIEKRLENMAVYSDSRIMSEFLFILF